MNIPVGTTHTVCSEVTEKNTAKSAKSGSLEVFATPFMCALMEQAASELCEKFCDEGITTVGTKLSVEHLAASAVSAKVHAKATVTEVDGRKISFEVCAFDESGMIGKGTHERFSVKSDRFMQKAQARLSETDEKDR